jgi:UDP-N-acetylmuramoyl-L-alanyl-D-glutamate--2,6-diaminopimelate ligase
MGAVAAAAADFSWVTSDNPRAEEPLAIIAAITSAMPTGTHAVEVDRRRAIGAALHHADRRDVVLIAGKGHETTQEIAGRKLPFSDAAVVSELLLPSSATARATDV